MFIIIFIVILIRNFLNLSCAIYILAPDNVHWNINSVDDILRDPTRLKGYTIDELQNVLGSDWNRGVYGSNGGGWKLMNGDISIFYHPGGGIHGGSYYGIASGATGKIKVVNPETYIPLKGDKATIMYE